MGTDAQIICEKNVRRLIRWYPRKSSIDWILSHIAICDGTRQARACPAPNRTPLGGPGAELAQCLQNCPQSDDATPAACVRSGVQRSRLIRLEACRMLRVPASSRGVSPRGAKHQGKLSARRPTGFFNQNGVEVLTSRYGMETHSGRRADDGCRA